MLQITIVAHDLGWISLEYELKQILTCGSDCMCLGEIRKFQSPQLPVWNILSVILVNMGLSGCLI